MSWTWSEIKENHSTWYMYEQESVKEEKADILACDKIITTRPHLISAVKVFLCLLLTWFIKKSIDFFLLRPSFKT